MAAEGGGRLSGLMLPQVVQQICSEGSALQWDATAGCYHVLDGEAFESRFDELRRKRKRGEGAQTHNRPFSQMTKHYTLLAGDFWAKTGSRFIPVSAASSAEATLTEAKRVLGSDGRGLAVGAGSEAMAALVPHYTGVNVQPVSSAADGAPPLRSETSNPAVNPASGAAVEAAAAQRLASSAEDLLREDLVWEDTKMWVGFIWQSKEQCLQDLQIDEQTLKAWYMGTSRPRHITAWLRQQIKAIRDKQKQHQAHGNHHTTRRCEACRGKHSKHTCDKATLALAELESQRRNWNPLRQGGTAAAAQPQGGGGVIVIDDDSEDHASSSDAAAKSKTARAEPMLCTAGAQPAACGGTGRGGKWAEGNEEGRALTHQALWHEHSAVKLKTLELENRSLRSLLAASLAARRKEVEMLREAMGNDAQGRLNAEEELQAQHGLREQALSNQAQRKEVHRLYQTMREQASREQDLKEQVRKLHCLAEHRRHVVNSLKRKVTACETASESQRTPKNTPAASELLRAPISLSQ